MLMLTAPGEWRPHAWFLTSTSMSCGSHTLTSIIRTSVSSSYFTTLRPAVIVAGVFTRSVTCGWQHLLLGQDLNRSVIGSVLILYILYITHDRSVREFTRIKSRHVPLLYNLTR
ncbi:hypothetical protein SORBI_3003G242700 [Sorghum bicolor]|uniref:Uncharacterized protein n=1 Tax=Sorghum bicolor TaxID=4558 RepID=C5XFA7_SORBI|nr:hypothetical protein SORBI_3003G242700 [Sorghum bicolor]